MGKMMDPKNVTVRADRMMKDHLAMFTEYFGSYERDGSRYCFAFDENTAMKIYYENYSKLLTKTFSTTVRFTVRHVEMEHDWKAKLILSGKLKVERISLKALDRDSKAIVDGLNENALFMDELFRLLQGFDLQGLTMEYSKEEAEMHMILRPYPGAFIWVKMPPIYYDVRLKPEEVKKMYAIAEFLSRFYSGNQFM